MDDSDENSRVKAPLDMMDIDVSCASTNNSRNKNAAGQKAVRHPQFTQRPMDISRTSRFNLDNNTSSSSNDAEGQRSHTSENTRFHRRNAPRVLEQGSAVEPENWNLCQSNSMDSIRDKMKPVNVRDDALGVFGNGDKWNFRDETEKAEEFVSDEVYRKETVLLLARVNRDSAMKRRKEKYSEDIEDISTDEFVVPSVLSVKEEKERDIPVSSFRIHILIETILPVGWSDSDVTNTPDTNIDVQILRTADKIADEICKEDLSLVMDMAYYPPQIKQRPNGILLRPVIIDGCAVVKQVDHNYRVSWMETIGAKETFQRNKVLLIRPIVQVVVRFLLMGHKVTVLLPTFYKNPIFANIRQKVDDLDAYKKLVSTGIIKYIEERGSHEWLMAIKNEVSQVGGVLISSSELKRLAMRGNQDEELVTQITSQMLTPYFVGPTRKLILPLHISEKRKILQRESLLYFRKTPSDIGRNDTEEFQMTVEDQIKQVNMVQDLFELALLETRGVQLLRRIGIMVEKRKREMQDLEAVAGLTDMDNNLKDAFAV